ncbi:hypothetical protein JCM10207_001074 [Rhodosporidiobolus poonsookiae]
MLRPTQTSAYLAQQAIQAAAASAHAVGRRPRQGSIDKSGNEPSTAWSSDGSDTEDEDDLVLIDEQFLDPTSDEGIACKLAGYAAPLSSFGRDYVLSMSRDVMQEVTGLSESVEDAVHILNITLRGRDTPLVMSRRLEVEEQATFQVWERERRAAPPPANSPSARGATRETAAPALTDALSSLHLDTPLSVSSAVLHTHTLPMPPPPPPAERRRRSRSPPLSTSISPILSPPPFTDLPSAAAPPRESTADAEAQLELIEMYHYAGAHQPPSSDREPAPRARVELDTDLDQWLDDAIEARGLRRRETMVPQRDALPSLAEWVADLEAARQAEARLSGARERADFTFEIVQEEEVQEEEVSDAEEDGEGVTRRARGDSAPERVRRREVVGR